MCVCWQQNFTNGSLHFSSKTTSVVFFFTMSPSANPIWLNIMLFAALPLSTRIHLIRQLQMRSYITKLSCCGSITCPLSVSSNTNVGTLLTATFVFTTRTPISLATCLACEYVSPHISDPPCYKIDHLMV